jgi:hypothetical protein
VNEIIASGGKAVALADISDEAQVMAMFDRDRSSGEPLPRWSITPGSCLPNPRLNLARAD